MLTIFVGSLNPIKVKAVEKGFKKFYEQVTVKGVSVNSGVSTQPIGLKETVEGAVNRARQALKAGGDLGVGLEAGLIQVPKSLSGYLDFQFCAILDKRGVVTLGASPGFEYPPYVISKVLDKRVEIGEIMEEISGIENIGKNIGAIGYLTRNVITREKLAEQAVLMALVPRIRRELYSL
ncbi:MAG: inosine/xanthosine triphosphatase [Candidatus Odinarchaeia archaeon]